MAEDSGLEAAGTLAGHCCREIESGVRDVLRGLGQLTKPSGHREDVLSILNDLGVPLNHPVGVLWATSSQELPLHAMATASTSRSGPA